jgi:uncharacterized C2H2 Zn-finger protein
MTLPSIPPHITHIDPRRARSSIKAVFVSEHVDDTTTANNSIPTIHWAENELYPTASLPKSSSSLKDYRPPKLATEAVLHKVEASLAEQEDPSQPVSLVSHGAGHFKCSRCNVKFKDVNIPACSNVEANNNSAVVKHCLNVHGTRAMVFRCPVCTKAFATTSTVEEHMRTHVDRTTVTNALLSSTSVLLSSTSNNAGDVESELECSHCHKVFQNKPALKNHLQV